MSFVSFIATKPINCQTLRSFILELMLPVSSEIYDLCEIPDHA